MTVMIIVFICTVCLGIISSKGPLFSKEKPWYNNANKKGALFFLFSLIILSCTYYQNEETEKNKQLENKITETLLNQLNERIDAFYNVIFENTTFEFNRTKEIDLLTMSNICENCDLNKITRSSKIITYNPIVLKNTTVKENLLSEWTWIINYISEIEKASSFINPKAFELIVRMKKCSLYSTINIISKPLGNTNLKAWDSQFYEFNILKNELDVLLVKLSKNNKN